MASVAAPADDLSRVEGAARRPADLLVVRGFLIAFAAVLVGYMFMGRGFAHLGFPPIYVGEMVLLVGLAATGYAFFRSRVHARPILVVWLLLGFMVIGVARTVPYLGEYGFDALRDAVLWGYALFALMIYVLADRALALDATRLYGWVVPVFAVWLPICFNVFVALSGNIDTNELGSNVPLIFFKSGDMSVHVVGSIAFLVLAAGPVKGWRTFLLRAAITVPLLWAALVAGATNRGGLLAFVTGLGVVAVLAYLLRRSRNWLPMLAAVALLAVVLIAPSLSIGGLLPSLTPTATATASATAAASASSVEGTSAPETPGPVGSPGATDGASPGVTPSPGFAAPSLVANSGFELGPVDSGTVEGWTQGAGSYAIVAEGAHLGEHFASIHAFGGGYESTLTSASFSFEGGTDISVSAWAKAIDGRPKVEIYVKWYDGSDALISSVFLESLVTEGSTSWQEFSGFLTAPDNTTSAEILIYEATGGGAAVGIDEVIVEAGEFIVPPPPPEGRPATLEQIVENIGSIFSSTDEGLEGTRRFRLRWWTAIVNYTVFGDYFWTGKGFGVNLADADGFQPNVDGSLRAPHNSHITALARMGVPGFVAWIALMAAFGIGLFRSVLAHRRTGDLKVAAVGAWLLAYWIAMMVDTSFDPYIEGPQGGIWFWAVIGLGMVVIRLDPRRREA